MHTAASHSCIGAVLSQVQNGKERVIAFASNKLSKCQRAYCITRKELLAAYNYVLQFKHYLVGNKFLLRTDHKALEWILNWKKPNTSQYCMWKSELEVYDFDIQHRKGEMHGNADALFRYVQCEQCELQHADPRKKRNVKRFNISELDVKSVEEDKILNCIEDSEEFFRAQMQDLHISEIIDIMNKRKIANPKNKYLRIQRDLRRRGETLYKVDRNNRYQLIVPDSLIPEILRNYHDKFSHAGINKCIDVLKERYYWPSMEKDVINHIKSCTSCNLVKDKNGRQKAAISKIKACTPFELVCIDIAGPFQYTRSNNRYILGMIDHFTKYVVLVPIKSVDAKTIARTIVKHWLTKFGMPNILMSENGKCFESEVLNEMLRICGVQRRFSPPYHQQSNGLVERLFKTTKQLLSASVLEFGREWDEVLPLVEMTLRATKQKSTGYSSFEILYGDRMILPADIPLKIDHDITVSNYLNKISAMKEKIYSAMERGLSKTNKNTSMVENRAFSLGQMVMIKKTVTNNRMPITKFVGPYEIIAKQGRCIYTVKDLTTGITYRRHYDHIKSVTTQQLQKETKPQGEPQRKQYYLRNRNLGRGNVG